MSKRYGRRLSLLVSNVEGDAFELSQLRVRFTVRQRDIQTPNTLSARIYNLSSDTAAKIGVGVDQKIVFNRVTLRAGYVDDQYDTIFQGNIKQTIYGRENQTDTFFQIVAGDGERAYNYAVVTATLSAGSNASAQQRAEALASLKAQGVDFGFLATTRHGPLPRGKVLCESAASVMRGVAKNENMTWAIVNEKAQMILKDSCLPGVPIELNSRTGLLGLPQQEQDGIHMRALLDSRFRVGKRVTINNEALQLQPMNLSLGGIVPFALLPAVAADGTYRIMVVEHEGDSRGNTWESRLICLSAQEGTLIPPTLRPRIIG